MKTVIIVQARMESSRFPGKIMEQVAGVPQLIFQYERLCRARNADLVAIATTRSHMDDPVVELCEHWGIECFRGSEEDVLSRYYEAAACYHADVVVRSNADCPLIDPGVVDLVINRFLGGQPGIDYAANILEETFPVGMHIEVLSRTVLERIHFSVVDPEEREHVTPHIYRNPGTFRIESVVHKENLSHHRWTIDFPEDLELVRRVVDCLYPENPEFDMYDVVRLLEEHYDWMAINSHHKKRQSLQ